MWDFIFHCNKLNNYALIEISGSITLASGTGYRCKAADRISPTCCYYLRYRWMLYHISLFEIEFIMVVVDQVPDQILLHECGRLHQWCFMTIS
jgi:hypothetical protein